jgi:hypothetical protein
MPPTISVTVGKLEPAAAADPVAVEPLELLELLQAARPAMRAAALAVAAILRMDCLNMGLLLLYP